MARTIFYLTHHFHRLAIFALFIVLAVGLHSQPPLEAQVSSRRVVRETELENTESQNVDASDTNPNDSNASDADLGSVDPEDTVRPLIETYCGKCHTGDEAEGEFQLTELDGDKTDVEIAKRWEEVATAIDDSYMPPEESPQPTPAEKEQIIEWIKVNAVADQQHSLLRRMNQVEYENTIRDLLELDRDGFSNPNKILKIEEYFQPERKKLPRYVFAVSHYAFPDQQRPELLQVSSPPVDLPAEHGFTNDVKALQFTPLLVEKYIQLGREIVTSPTFPAIAGSWETMFVPTPSDSGTTDSDAVDSMSVDVAVELAKQRLVIFLPRAFRREVSEQEIQSFTGVFAENFRECESFTQSMQATVSAVLVSPDFLFLFQASEQELSPAQQQSFINASRLSYFLWASMPDATLMELAKAGQLLTNDQLREQTQRMMLDKKVKSLATDFGMQWLKVNRLSSSLPDKEKFEEFYARKKQPIGVAMAIEQLLLFEAIMVEDRSILDFVHADFAYLNRDLLFWYGYSPESYIGYRPPSESAQDFFRIKFPADHNRGGAITAGATLVLTSTSLRSSPVFRGAWVSEAIFNRPPPPPPANVPALEAIETNSSGKHLNPREKLALHRNDPNCSSCHSKIDPLGFGLEQFDAVGKIRQRYEDGDRIDSTGEFEDDRFDHALGLKRMILRKKDVFVRAFVEHVLRYAINRELTLADAAEVDRITLAVLEDECRFHSVIEHVVISSVFLGEK